VWAFVSRLAVRAAREYANDRGPHLAGSIAYRVLFSLFPLVIVLASFLSLVVDGHRVVDLIVSNVPLTEDSSSQLRTLLEQTLARLGAVGFLGILGLLWAAGGMMAAIRSALNEAWDLDEHRPWLQGKLVDLLLLLAVAALALLSFGLTVATRFVGRYAGGAVEEVGLGSTFDGVVFGVVIPFVLALSAVLFVYRFVPASSPRTRDVLPAAALVAAVFVLLQHGFGFYLENFGNYNAVYGSIGAVVTFLLFVYLSASVLLLGAEVAAEWPGVRAEIARGEGLDEERPPFVGQVRDALKGLVVRDERR
jgi:membrane protein